MASSERTTDHDTIRKWIEQRDGHPAVVANTMEDEGGGILRVDFPGYSGETSLQRIGWEEFFEIFEDRELAFLYQDKTEDGKESRFSKFVRRDGSED
jgi:hypothetical protein